MKYEALEITEFTLPKDMPHFCNSCFSCIYNGEHTCPHAGAVQPIVKAMQDADLIILTSPVYGFDVSGQMKALLDHLCYQWMSHRPDPRMFQKIGLTFTTAAGAGLKHTTKTMRDSLKYWGVKRIYSGKYAVSASSWSEVAENKLIKIQKQTAQLAKRIAKAHRRIDRMGAPVFTKVFFKMMRGMMKKNTWNQTDRNHWKSLGWLQGEKPF